MVHSEKKLYLVFEFLSQDLKKYMDSMPASELPLHLVKVPGDRQEAQAATPPSPRGPAPATWAQLALPAPLCRATSSSSCRE